MTDQLYDWNRFFYPREGRISLRDDGFLYDPESEYGSWIHPDVISFDDVIAYPCLIILGEPGIGKTVTLKKGYDSNEELLKQEGHEIIWLDLGAYGSEDRLYSDLFNTQIFKNWLSGSHELHIFLDSLDECLMQLKHVSKFLLLEIRKLPIERLRIRIACRTSEWPYSFEQGLKKIWEPEKVGVFEITPLRKKDVIEAANANEIDSTSFLSEIIEKNAAPFAINPITLKFLLDTFQSEGSLPSNLVDLYFKGCRCLCTEFNINIRDVRRTESLDSEKKLLVAMRIAAITLLTNKETISLIPLREYISQDEVHISQLVGGYEYQNSDRISINHYSIHETFNTSLFTSRGPEKVGWVHRSYSEFLAALYFSHNRVSTKQIMSLLLHHENNEKKIVPQLHGIAIWLTIMNDEILEEIINIEPDLLLRGSLTTIDDSKKSSIISSLLSLYENGKLLLRDPNVVSNFIKLNNPNMADILSSYIFDGEKEIGVRTLAINIARLCKLVSLEGDLLKIVHSLEQPLELRIYAASYISDIGSEEAKKSLITLAKGEAGDDPEDDLKGFGLFSVWPKYLNTDELFSNITQPKRSSYGGSYQQFLLNYIVEKLDTDELTIALEWVRSIYEIDPVPYFFESIADQIILKASEHLNDSRILESFAYTACIKLSNYKPLARDRFDRPLKQPFFDSLEIRYRLIEEMSKHYQILKNYIYTMFRSDTPLVYSDDLEWLVQRLAECENGENKDYWINLIRYAFRSDDNNHFRIIYYASQTISELKKVFSWVLGPVELESETAKQMRDNYDREQEFLKKIERPLLDPSPFDVSLQLLSDFENGDLDAWWRLNRVMMFKVDGSTSFNDLDSDLTNFPVWNIVDENTKFRIIKAAEKYLFSMDPKPDEWLGTNKIYYPAFAGYRAISLLFKIDIHLLDNLPSEIWKKWVSIILTFPNRGTEDDERKREIIKLTYNHASEDMISIILFIIDVENEKGEYLYILDFVEDIWDANFRDALFKKVLDESLKPKCMGNILERLLLHQNLDAEEFAKNLITIEEPEQETDKEKRLIAASELIRFGRDAGWSHIWPIICDDADFGKLVLETVAMSHFNIDFWTKLEIEQVGCLNSWLLNHYPQEEDLVHNGIYSPGPRDEIARLRNDVLSYLRINGSIEACKIIEELVEEFPQYPGLTQLLIEARNIMRINTWIPPRPEEIMALVHNRDTRFVQNGLQLLSIISESLDRLEQKLQGETAASEFLWNKIEDGKYIPKEENSFSNFVKIHLDEDLKTKGIVVNREVEIRRGEVTDIHVDAILIKERKKVIDVLKAIIEVKGCWHPELETAIETQLVDRYLRENQTKYGMYLVGWYLCDKWADDDYKKRNCSQMSQEEIRRYLDDQAVRLSDQHNIYLTSKIVNVTLR